MVNEKFFAFATNVARISFVTDRNTTIKTKDLTIMFLVTHTDLDGVGCEVVARCFYPELSVENVFHCDYAGVNGTVCKLLRETNQKLLISDVSVTQETALLIQENYSDRVELFDHHQTAKEYLEGYDWAIVDLSKSATLLMFDTFARRKFNKNFPVTLPTFAYHVNDYDLWHHTTVNSTNLNDLMVLLGKRKFVDTIMQRIHQGAPLINEQDLMFIEALNERKQRYFRERLDKAVVVDDRLLIIASRHHSELSEFIRNINNPPESWKNVKYVDMINPEKRSHSLRSYDNNFDVSEVAKMHGGGGHPKASGYPMKALDPEMLKEL